MSSQEVVNVVQEHNDEADSDKYTLLAKREWVITVLSIGPPGRKSLWRSGPNVEEMLIHDFLVAKLEPKDYSVPNRNQSIKEDGEEDVVIEAGKV